MVARWRWAPPAGPCGCSTRRGAIYYGRSRGIAGAVVYVDFNHDGTLLATTSWDTTTRLWDTASGEQLLVTDIPCYSFSRDNVWLGIGRFGGGRGALETGAAAGASTTSYAR